MTRRAIKWLAIGLVLALLAAGLLRALSARKAQQEAVATASQQKTQAVVELAPTDVVKAQQRELAQAARISQPAASQHLSVLRAEEVVVSRKSGNQVYYRLRDPALVEVLDVLKRYFNTHLQRSAAKLDRMHADHRRSR